MMDYVGPQPFSLAANKQRAIPKLKISDRIAIIGIDPGGVTGWSLLVLNRNVLGQDIFQCPFDMILNTKVKWFHGEVDCKEENRGVFQLLALIDQWPSAAVVVEDFYLNPQSMQKKTREVLSPVRITAKLEYHLWQQGRYINLQQPSFAKGTATDARLKNWRCYTSEGGLGHARDADRHVLMFLRRCLGRGGLVMRSLGWPQLYGGNDGA